MLLYVGCDFPAKTFIFHPHDCDHETTQVAVQPIIWKGGGGLELKPKICPCFTNVAVVESSAIGKMKVGGEASSCYVILWLF